MFHTIILAFWLLSVVPTQALNLTARCEKVKLIRSSIIKNKSHNDANIAPISDDEPIYVEMSIEFKRIISLNAGKGQLMVTVFVTAKWNDYRLKWNNSNGIETIRVKHTDVWNPHIRLLNTLGSYSDEAEPTTLFEVYSNGTVVWSEPRAYTSYCKTDAVLYPFDKHNCFLDFVSWSYDASEVLLVNGTIKKPKDDDKTDVGWDFVEPKDNQHNFDLLNETILRNSTNAGQLKFSHIKFHVFLERVSLPYVVDYLIPTFLISILSIFSFLIPVQTGEKVSFSVTIFLALIVNSLTSMGEIHPSPTVPVITTLNSVIIFFVATSIVIIVFSSRFLKEQQDMPQVPERLKDLLITISKKLPIRIPDFNQMELDQTAHHSERSEMQSKKKHIIQKAVQTKNTTLEIYGRILSEVASIHNSLKEQEFEKQNYEQWLRLFELLDKLLAIVYTVAFSCLYVVVIIVINCYDPNSSSD